MTGSKAAASLTGISHLQLIGVIEVDPDGRNHPGVEQRRQDLLSYGIGDEMEMEGVPPVDTYTQTGALRLQYILCNFHRNFKAFYNLKIKYARMTNLNALSN